MTYYLVVSTMAFWDRFRKDEFKPKKGLEKVVESSVTSDYVKEWGIKRIAEDGIQNHLPADSHGSKVGVEFRSGGEWFPYSGKNEMTKPVEAIRFTDDGTGFDYDLLRVFFSTKKGDKKSVGEHGEGIKMVSAACLNRSIDVQLRSKDWCAEPFFEELNTSGLKIQQLHYRVHPGQPRIQGSVTTFIDPPSDLVNYILSLDKKVLALRDKDPRVFKAAEGDILGDEDRGQLFIKGMHITDDYKDDILFGYNIIDSTNRDRNVISSHDLKSKIGDILERLNDKGLIKKILQAATKKKDYMEFSAMGPYSINHGKMWVEIFQELYGEKAVLSCSHDEKGESFDRLAKLYGYDVVKITSSDMTKVLKRCGVKTSKDIGADDDAKLLQGENYDPNTLEITVLPTSLTAKYRAEKWNERRIVLDSLANHMPSDSKGTKVDIEYLVNGKWVPRSGDISTHKVQALRFADDGRGYDSGFLQVLATSKEGNEQSVGVWGEGIKMVCNAFLRLKEKSHKSEMAIRLRSRDWAAMPFQSDLSLDSTKTHQLNFRLAQGLEARTGSVTTFYSPSEMIIDHINSIERLVLDFNTDYTPLSKSKEGAVFDGVMHSAANQINKGTCFVRGFYITDSFKNYLLFSYNFTAQQINPDRDEINHAYVKSAVHSIISSCVNPEVITTIIRNSVDNERDMYEFQTINFDKESKIARLYRDTFHSMFGEKAVLYTDSIFLSVEAVHRGYTPIKVNRGIRQTLMNAGVLTDEEVVSKDLIPEYVDFNDLTEPEKKTLMKHREIDAILDVESADVPSVYTTLRAKNGEELGYPGFYNNEQGINLKRSQLGSILSFALTYIHEKGHEQTGGAPDASDRFRNFFENNIAKYVIAKLEGGEGERSAQEAAEIRQLRAELELYKPLIQQLKDKGWLS
ncbi:hypothetical protein KY331_01675 [Candidatus Woesearchaeota archaeon]|nr:hypothetical protein [Candidatus Woesearchaeota archaeon]